MPSNSRSADPDVSTMDAVHRFNDAFSRQDIDAVMACMTHDCVFDTTAPAPDGMRFEGQQAVRETWEAFFRSSPEAVFETEEIFSCGDRCVVRWRYTWDPANRAHAHVRGVDLFRVRDGLVAEKLSYVKG